MSNSFYRYVNLVTRGNRGLVPAGQDVVSPEDGQTYTFLAGDMLVYNPDTNKTIDVAGIATARKVRWGVGHNDTGGLMATSIRHIGGDDIDLCKTHLKIKAQAPQCPLPHVIDFEFDCTWTGKDYGFRIDIDDWMTRAYFKEGAVGSLIYNLRTDLEGCTSCSQEQNCASLACQLAAKIRNDFVKGYPGVTKLGLLTGKPGTGIWAAQKFTNKVLFTIDATEVESTCGAGCAVKGLKSIGASGVDTKVFVNAVNPAAPEETLLEQMGSVIDQINSFLNGKGTAYLKQTGCCTYQIEVNTCLTGVTLTYHDDATSTGTVSAAFSAFTPNPDCVGCTDQDDVALTCGVRIFVDPLYLPCNCQYPDGNRPNTFVRKVRVTAFGEAWRNTTHRVVEVQAMKVHRGTGYEVQQHELGNSTGGFGFDHPSDSMYTQDRAPRPIDKSKLNQASVAICEKLYCVWSVITEEWMAGSNIRAHVSNIQTMSHLNIPREDETTIQVAQEVIEALAARGLCQDITEYECVSFES